jgi:DMSO/TMAO reductase YedYZ heme-binding membrane subunit
MLVLLYYVMLCNAMLCYDVLCCVVLCCVVLCPCVGVMRTCARVRACVCVCVYIHVHTHSHTLCKREYMCGSHQCISCTSGLHVALGVVSVIMPSPRVPAGH